MNSCTRPFDTARRCCCYIASIDSEGVQHVLHWRALCVLPLYVRLSSTCQRGQRLLLGAHESQSPAERRRHASSTFVVLQFEVKVCPIVCDKPHACMLARMQAPTQIARKSASTHTCLQAHAHTLPAGWRGPLHLPAFTKVWREAKEVATYS